MTSTISLLHKQCLKFDLAQHFQPQSYLRLYDTCLLQAFSKIPSQMPVVEHLDHAMWIRLVDWVFHCTQVSGIQDANVFFMTVDILRRKISSQKSTPPSSLKRDLQLTAVTSIFIASKLLEVTPLKLDFALETLGHGKFSRTQVVCRE